MADISIWQKTGHFYFALTLTAGFTSQADDSFTVASRQLRTMDFKKKDR
jgi:hypothetical protein